MKNMFYVGQKILCIDDANFDLEGELHPIKGHAYTIRDIYGHGQCKAFRLAEIVNSPKRYRDGGKIVYEECWFWASRFTPLEEYSDSMSIAMQLVQEIDQLDKPKNPIKILSKL